MMLVSVEIPVIGECFDFRIENEEQIPVSQLKREITEEVCQWKNLRFSGSVDKLWLYDERLEGILEDRVTVRASGLLDGDHLVLF